MKYAKVVLTSFIFLSLITPTHVFGVKSIAKILKKAPIGKSIRLGLGLSSLWGSIKSFCITYNALKTKQNATNELKSVSPNNEVKGIPLLFTYSLVLPALSYIPLGPGLGIFGLWNTVKGVKGFSNILKVNARVA